VCFHAQQCAEKYLKALLALHAVPFPKTHDLPELLLGIPQNVSVRLRPPDVAVLNRYSIEGRYPGDWEPITRWTLNRQWSQLDVSVTPSGSTSKASGSGLAIQHHHFTVAVERGRGRVLNCDMAIGMRRAAASLMLGWLVLLGRSPHVFAIAKIWGQGGSGVALLIPPDTHEEATQRVREQAHLLALACAAYP